MLSWASGQARQIDASAPDSQTVHALIDQGLANGFWRLDLPGGLERSFRVDTLEARINHALRSGWLAILIFNSFLLVDWLMANDVFLLAVLVRTVIFTPLGLMVIAVTQRHKATLVRKGTVSYVDWLTLISGLGAAVCLAVILFKSRSPYAHYYHAGFLVVVIYGNLVQQMTFRFAIAFSLGVLGIHVIGVFSVPDYPAPIRVAMIEMLIVTVLFTLTAHYLVEKSRRRRYLLLRKESTLVEDLSEVNMQLQKLSRADVLTGVANRRHFHEHLQPLWERARRAGQPLAVLMIDVDHFKAYNDHYGHPAGDECLKQVAQSVEKHLRSTGDFVARYGGEEFVALLPDTDLATASQAAERVREGIEALHMRHEASATGPVVTVSIGVASAVPTAAGLSADKLVSAADRALYDAKRGGRNRLGVSDVGQV